MPPCFHPHQSLMSHKRGANIVFVRPLAVRGPPERRGKAMHLRSLVALAASVALNSAPGIPVGEQSVSGNVFAGLPADSARRVAVRLNVRVHGQELDAMQPSISPDCRSVAFVCWNGVYIYELATRTTHDLCWAADGPG